MACCQGSKMDWEDITPPEIQNLRKQQATIASKKLSSGAGATPIQGPTSMPPDYLTLMASNMMSGLGGYGPYTMPGGVSTGGGWGYGPASWAGKYSAPGRFGGPGSRWNQPGPPPAPGMPPEPPEGKEWQDVIKEKRNRGRTK